MKWINCGLMNEWLTYVRTVKISLPCRGSIQFNKISSILFHWMSEEGGSNTIRYIRELNQWIKPLRSRIEFIWFHLHSFHLPSFRRMPSLRASFQTHFIREACCFIRHLIRLHSFIPSSAHRCRYAFHSFNYIPFTYVHYISLNFIPFHAASLLGLIQISLLQFISLLSFTHHHTIRVNLYFLLLIFFTLHFIDS